MRDLIFSIFIVLFTTSCASNLPANEDTSGLIPAYGAWCGPGHPKAGTYPLPIDHLDDLCKTHDNCYSNHDGTLPPYVWSQECDKNFIKDASKLFCEVHRARTISYCEGWLNSGEWPEQPELSNLEIQSYNFSEVFSIKGLTLKGALDRRECGYLEPYWSMKRPPTPKLCQEIIESTSCTCFEFRGVVARGKKLKGRIEVVNTGEGKKGFACKYFEHELSYGQCELNHENIEILSNPWTFD